MHIIFPNLLLLLLLVASPAHPLENNEGPTLNLCSQWKQICRLTSTITEWEGEGGGGSPQGLKTIGLLQVGNLWRDNSLVPLKLVYYGEAGDGAGGIDWTYRGEGYEDYLDNFSSGTLDSLPLTFSLDRTASRSNISAYRVTALSLVVEDFEEVGPFAGRSTPYVKELFILVRERRRKTLIRSDLLAGLKHLQVFTLMFQTSYGLYVSGLNPIPNLFQLHAHTLTKLISVYMYSPHADLSVLSFRGVARERSFNLQLHAPMLPPEADGRPFLPPSVLYLALVALPFPADIGTARPSTSTYWDRLCERVGNVTDPALAPFAWIPPEPRPMQVDPEREAVEGHPEAIGSYQSMNFILNVTAATADGDHSPKPRLVQERCPLLFDVSSRARQYVQFQLKGFFLDGQALHLLKGLKLTGISLQNCVLPDPQSFISSSFYGPDLISFSFLQNTVIDHSPVNISLPSICWAGECQSIKIGADRGSLTPTSVSFTSPHHDYYEKPSFSTLLDSSMNSTRHVSKTSVSNVTSIALYDVDVQQDFWDFLWDQTLKGTLDTVELVLSGLTEGHLASVFPCAREGAATDCCEVHFKEAFQKTYLLKLVSSDGKISQDEVDSGIVLNQKRLCGVRSQIYFQNIPIARIDSDAFSPTSPFFRWAVQKYKFIHLINVGLGNLHEGCFRGIISCEFKMTKARVSNLTRLLTDHCFHSFEAVDGELSEFAISSLNVSPWPFFYNTASAWTGCLVTLNLANNTLGGTLEISNMFKYFDCATELNEEYPCVLTFSNNNISQLRFSHDVPIPGESSHRNLSSAYEIDSRDVLGLFERTYTKRADIRIDLSFNKVQHLWKGSFQSIRGLRLLNISHNNIEILEGGFIMNRSCIGHGCYVDLSHNSLGATEVGLVALEEALRVQATDCNDTPIHTLDLSHNRLKSVPKYGTAIMASLKSMLGPISRPNPPTNRNTPNEESSNTYFTLNLQHNEIQRLDFSLCSVVEDVNVPTLDANDYLYVDLSYNNITYIAPEALTCGKVKLMLNLNFNRNLTTLPLLNDTMFSSLRLLSVAQTNVKSLPDTGSVHNTFPYLVSLNLEWSYDWKCCELWNFVFSYPPTMRSFNPSYIGPTDNLQVSLQYWGKHGQLSSNESMSSPIFFLNQNCVGLDGKVTILKAFSNLTYIDKACRLPVDGKTYQYSDSTFSLLIAVSILLMGAYLLFWLCTYCTLNALFLHKENDGYRNVGNVEREPVFHCDMIFVDGFEQEEELGMGHGNFGETETAWGTNGNGAIGSESSAYSRTLHLRSAKLFDYTETDGGEYEVPATDIYYTVNGDLLLPPK
eukprot:Nk52_evm45s210 gene=Nk52_evmTU45s210